MKLIKEGEKWVAYTRYEERHTAKNAGLSWDPARKVWWTKDANKAAQLYQYADDAATRMELKAILEEQKRSAELSRAASADIDIPCPEGEEYLPFQKAGIAYALSRPNTLIADQMGLGKTVQAIGVINADPTIVNCLIIVKASLKLNWLKELQRWLVRDLSVAIVDSATDFPTEQIVIINYERLKDHREAIRARQWDLLVVDESHYLKNSKAQRTKEVMGVWSRSGNKWEIEPIRARKQIFLTGTPILNRPVELWTTLRKLDPKRWTNFMDFARKYCDAKWNGWGWDFTGANENNLPELQEILRSTIMVRRTKEDVLKELPPKRRQIIELPANGLGKFVRAETRALNRARKKVSMLRAKAELAKAEGEDAYKKAAQALTNAVKVAFEEFSRLRHELALAKVPLVVEHVREALEEEPKVIVFAYHNDVADAIVKEFGDEAVLVSGRQSVEERQAAVDRFQKDPTCKVFVGTIGAAGVGFTLTAASLVVFAELDLVPGNVSQAEDRAHRIGQTNPVLIQHLVVDGSLDAHMVRLLVEKQNVIDKLLDETPSDEHLQMLPFASLLYEKEGNLPHAKKSYRPQGER